MGRFLEPPKPAYMEFQGEMLEAFNLLTDTMYENGEKILVTHGKFSQTNKEAASELRQATSLDASNYNKGVADAINKNLTDQVKDITPASCQNEMKDIIDKCSKYLAQNAEQNKEALNCLITLMKAQGDAPLAKIQGEPNSFADAVKKIEAATSLKNDRVDRGTYESVRSKLNELVKNNPEPKHEKTMPAAIEEVSKFLAKSSSEGSVPGAGVEGGPGGGPGGYLLGPDGKPILGPDGKPIPLGPDGKPRTMIGPDGVAILIGPDGKPILGPDGKPIRIGPDGKPLPPEADEKPKYLLGPDGKPILGPDGKPILLGDDGKPRTMIGPDGVAILIGPDGKPILGPDGKPIRIGPDGKPLPPEADVKPIQVEADVKPIQVEADVKPIQVEADVKPIQVEADVKPIQVEADVKPIQVEADVKPIQVEADVKPIQVEADVKPIQVEADVKPIQVEADVTPIQVEADVKPIQVEADVKPIQVEADVKPIQVEADVKPIQVEADVKPIQVEADVKPIQVEADVKPIQVEADVTPIQVEADVKPIQVEADVKPIQVEADVKPIQVEADVKPIRVEADVKPIPVEADVKPIQLEAGDKEVETEEDKKRADARRKLASGGRALVHDAEYTKALKILQDALRSKGNVIFYKQGQYEITCAQAAVVLTTRPKVDKAIKEAPETGRLAVKFERRLSGVVEGITPPALSDAMLDVVIESGRDVAEHFLSKNYGAAVKEGLIIGMQKRGNELLVETGYHAETFFFAAQRIKLAKTLEADEPYPKVAREISRQLNECMKCRPMPQRMTGTLHAHVRHVSKYLSKEIMKPNEKIEAMVVLLGEMEAAGDSLLVEGKIPKTHKDAAAYLRSLTSFEDNIKRSDRYMRRGIEAKMKSLLANLPPAGYTHAIMDQVITEQATLLTSYLSLQAEKTDILVKVLEQIKKQDTSMVLRHGTVHKTYFDAFELLRGKNADQLQSARTPDYVVIRKLQIKLTNLMKDVNVSSSQKPLLSIVVDDITNYLAINLLEPQIIKVCKCMTSVFVQCELWCEEILRRVSRPCCTCSQHVPAGLVEDLAHTVGHVGPSDIEVNQCPSMSHPQSPPTPFCPSEQPPQPCPRSRTSSVHYMFTTPHFNPSASHLTPTRLGADGDTVISEPVPTKQRSDNHIPFLATQTPSTNVACSRTLEESTVISRLPTVSTTSKITSKLESGMPSEATSKIMNKAPSKIMSKMTTRTTFSSLHSERQPQAPAPFWQMSLPMYATRRSRRPRRRRDVHAPCPAPRSSTVLDSSSRALHTSPAKIDDPSYPDFSAQDSVRKSASSVTTDQMSELHAMMVSLMWNVRAWRDWLQEIIARALTYQPDSSTPEDEQERQWISYRTRVLKEALQWRQYNQFSRQLTLRLALRYKDTQIVSPTRATEQMQAYMYHQREMLDIIEIFNKWTQWLMVILKRTETFQPDSNTPSHDLCWNHFKTRVEENLDDWIIYNDFLKNCWESKYSSITKAWTREGPVWVVSACGAVPSGAVPAGVFQGEVMWVARTSHNSEVLPAALLPSKHCCLVYAGGAVHEYTKYQVMCNAAVQWVRWRAGDGGEEKARAVHVSPGVLVGRVDYHGHHFVGAVLAPHQYCHVVINERPYSFRSYELLVLSGPNIDPASVPTTSHA